MMSFTKICVSLKTTHGFTYCEVYYPIKVSVNEENGHESRTTGTTVLMVHGLGGSVEHWQQSELPMMLANQGHTVICFDWYSHGKSSRHSSKTTQHNLEFYFSQMFDIIHSPELPILQSKSFVAHGFSMGCYILLEYCVRFKPFSKGNRGSNPPVTDREMEQEANENATNHPFISKIILQSPWDGHFPVPLRALLHVPLLLRLCKPTDMAEIKSVRTLREILLTLDQGINYRQSLEVFADMVLHGADQPEPSLGGVSGPSAVACPVLVIVGTREPPFAITARRIVKRIMRKDSAQSTELAPSSNTTSSVENNSRESSSDVKLPAVTFRSCKCAGHMSFAKAARDSYVKTFFHKEIAAFIDQATPDLPSVAALDNSVIVTPPCKQQQTAQHRETGTTATMEASAQDQIYAI